MGFWATHKICVDGGFLSKYTEKFRKRVVLKGLQKEAYQCLPFILMLTGLRLVKSTLTLQTDLEEIWQKSRFPPDFFLVLDK